MGRSSRATTGRTPSAALAAAAFAAAVLASRAAPAAAQDWALSGFVATRLTLDSGGGARDEDPGAAVTADLGVVARLATPRLQLSFAPGLRVLQSSTSRDDTPVAPRFNGSALLLGPRDRLGASLSLTPDFARSRRFDDAELSVSDVDALELLVNGALDWTRSLDQTRSLTASMFGRAREYPEGGDAPDPTRSFGASLGFTEVLDGRTRVTATGQGQAFLSEAAGAQDSRSFSLRAALTRQATPRLGLTGTLGGSVTARDDGEVTPGLVGGVEAQWRPTPTARLGARLFQDVDQSRDGAVQNVTSLGLTASEALDPVSSVAASLRLSARAGLFGDGGADDEQTLVFSPRYTRTLTEDWSLSVGAALRFDDGDDRDGAGELFVSVSRGFSLLGADR